MKNRFFVATATIVCFLFGMQASAQVNNFAQKSHLGIAVGMMNYSGFMNTTSFTFEEAKPAIELMYRYDVTDNFHVRAIFMTGSLSKDNGATVTVPNRSGSFKTAIFEASILPEYDFLSLKEHKATPYVFVGGGYYSLINYQKNKTDFDKPNNAGFNFRGGLGVKYAINPSVQLFLEGSRREFSKSIDFYESKNSPSRYYSIMVGASFSLGNARLKELW